MSDFGGLLVLARLPVLLSDPSPPAASELPKARDFEILVNRLFPFAQMTPNFKSLSIRTAITHSPSSHPDLDLNSLCTNLTFRSRGLLNYSFLGQAIWAGADPRKSQTMKNIRSQKMVNHGLLTAVPFALADLLHQADQFIPGNQSSARVSLIGEVLRCH